MIRINMVDINTFFHYMVSIILSISSDEVLGKIY
jgi:hypothetical protein